MSQKAQDSVRTVVSVDGDKLAEALRRVSPFMADKGRENLEAVYAEADGQTLQLTATDGFRMAHLTINMAFPVGNYLLKAEGVKDFAFRHFNGAQVNIGCFVANTLQMGEVQVELVQTPYIDYPAAVPETFDVEVIVDTKKWIKAIRGSGADIVGIVYSPDGCRMYSQNVQGDTIGCDPLPAQMFSGPELKLAYKAEHFRRALTSCGPTATIQVVDPKKVPEGKANPTLFEAEEYWHLLQPRQGFPREVNMTPQERDALSLMDEAVKSVRSGDVPGKLMVGNGKFYLEIGPHITVTQVLVQEPKLHEGAGHPLVVQSMNCATCGDKEPHVQQPDGSWLCIGCRVRENEQSQNKEGKYSSTLLTNREAVVLQWFY